MNFDYSSVLMAVGAAGAALCVTLLSGWLRRREADVLLWGGVAMAIIVASVGAFILFAVGGSNPWIGLLACLLLTTGFSVAYGVGRQFRTGSFPAKPVRLLSLVLALPMTVSFLAGYPGVGFTLVNAFSAALLFATAREYWLIRAESRLPLTALAGLYAGVGVSFGICVADMLVHDPLSLSGPVDGWPEVLNLVACLIGLTGIGALTVTVYQERISRAYEIASITDALTGLANRRAVFDRFAGGRMAGGTGIILFDLDDFKSINDRFGHEAGDRVLRQFAAILRENIRAEDMAARMGGEEFAIVLLRTSPEMAVLVAERVRLMFAAIPTRVEGLRIFSTVSAGVAVSEEDAEELDTLLRVADKGLYLAKNAGRNRVTPGLRVA